MGRRKKTLSAEDSFKQNRSSLHVNLSYGTNLTDSGNGSFRTIEPEHDSLANTGRSTRSRTRLKSMLQREIYTSCPSSNNVILKNMSVVLEDINKVDKALNTKCKILSDAILSKTNRIFPGSELSVKTSMVLQNLACESNEKHNNEVLAPKSTMTTANNADGLLNQSPHDICTTPKQKKELGLQNKADQETCLDNKVSKKITTCISPVLERSPILTQGRRKLNSSKCLIPKAKKLYSRNEPSESESMCSHNISSISDASMLGVFPLACSSMLEEWTSSQNNVCARVGRKDPLDQTNAHTRKTLLSMEMTCGGLIIEKPTSSESQNSSKDCHIAHKPKKNTIIIENISAQKSQHTHDTMKKQLDTNCLSQNVQMNFGDMDESVNCRRSSMNVNTSIDVLTENNKAYTTRKAMNRIYDGQLYSASKAGKETCKIIPEEEEESICMISESLQMNTSLRAPFGLSFTNNKPKNSQSSNSTGKTDAVHNSSSANTIRIYNKENISNCESTGNTENVARIEAEMEAQNITIKSKNKRSINDNVEGKSYVEPTPYPPTRSMIWRSLIKQNTGLHSLSNKNMDPDTSRQLQRIPKNTVIVSDSDLEITPHSESSNTTDMENTSPKQKTNKRKLYPRRENSGLFSFSPVETSYIPQTQNLFPRKKKIPKKNMKLKRKFVSVHEPEDKPKNKPQKQPRKIKSKKIVIKKLANVDSLKKLEDQGGPNKNLRDISNTSSPYEFQKKKYISTVKSAKDLTRKIVIVTTGLSKEDKSLVKSVIKSIGKGRMEASISPRTTYVVTTGVRTLNLLHGIIRGCWLVTMKWVLESLEQKHWLDPEKYEIVPFSQAVTVNRKERIRAQQYGVSYVPDLFATSGLIYVENGTSPPASALKDLIKVAGGRITENMSAANICISSTGLRETWVLDSITTGELQPIVLYKRN